MNKLSKILALGLLFIVLLKCNSLTKFIVIDQMESKHPIIIRLDHKYKIIRGFKFPSILEIKNNSYSKKSFIMVDYLYNDSLTKRVNLGIELYKVGNQKLKRISNNKKKTIPSKGSLKYIFYSRHFVDSTKSTQQQFEPYIKKMLAAHKDTLHIGTVSEFKQKHQELFEKLTKNDSISIQFLDGKKLGERITVPVEW